MVDGNKICVWGVNAALAVALLKKTGHQNSRKNVGVQFWT